MKLVKEVLEEFLNNGSWTRKQPREQAHIPQVSSATSSFWQHLGFTSTAEQRNSTKIYRLKPLLDFELPISLQLMDISLQARAMQKSLWPLCTGTEAAAEQCDCHQDPFSGTTDTQHWCIGASTHQHIILNYLPLFCLKKQEPAFSLATEVWWHKSFL